MGLSFFLNDLFSPPKILTLENGKFALRKFNYQHILVWAIINFIYKNQFLNELNVSMYLVLHVHPGCWLQ